MNCSDADAAMVCKVNNYTTTLSQHLVCDHGENCDNGYDEICVEADDCKVHKHKLCNGINDCESKYDELSVICDDLMNETCVRTAYLSADTPIPKSWVCDGIVDCLDNKDEDMSYWKTCGKDNRVRCVSKDEECVEMFKCPGKEHYIEQHKLCDKTESCGNEKSCVTTHEVTLIII